jgi:hypothetical protein
MNADVPEDNSVVIPENAMFTDLGKAKAKTIKDNKKCIAYYAIALKTMKLQRPRQQSGQEVKKVLVAKYLPDDVFNVSELKKRLNSVTLKGNQDRLELFEELVKNEHAYSETAATLGTSDLSGAVSGAAT